MRIDILTVFPEMFEGPFSSSILGRARENGLVEINCVDIRPFSACKHKNTDDYPFGGGAGMLMLAQPVADAMKATAGEDFVGKRIFLSPRGAPFTQRMAEELAKQPRLIFLCGHYEGVDQRAIDKYIDMEISLGDFVLTGGEIAAMAVTDCVCRLLPGVLGSEESPLDESFSMSGLLEYPQYTRPRVFEGAAAPDVLLNGDHAKIAAWRRREAILVTREKRPDLLKTAKLTDKERKWLRELDESSESSPSTTPSI